MGDLKPGLIGTGAIGRTHIERINNVLQGAKVIAVSDAFAEAGKRVADNSSRRARSSSTTRKLTRLS